MVVVSYIFIIFMSKLGKIPVLTVIFLQLGWNHQLEKRRNISRREKPKPRSCLVVWGPIFVKGWVLAPGEAGKTGSSLGDEDDESMEIQMFFCHFRSSQKVWLFLAVRFMRVLRGGGLQGEDF